MNGVLMSRENKISALYTGSKVGNYTYGTLICVPTFDSMDTIIGWYCSYYGGQSQNGKDCKGDPISMLIDSFYCIILLYSNKQQTLLNRFVRKKFGENR